MFLKLLSNRGQQINLLIRGVPNKITCPIHLIDERFTSKIAKQTIINSGLSKSKRKDKGNIDKISACIILQSFLEKRDNQNAVW